MGPARLSRLGPRSPRGLQEEQEARIAIEQLRQQLAADAESTGALDALLPL